LFELGNIVLANMDLHREARPFVEALTRVSGHVVHLAVFDGRQAVVIHRSDPKPDAIAPVTFIESAPVHCTSVGKAIRAFQRARVMAGVMRAGLQRFTESTITEPAKLRGELARIEKRGYAVDNSEHQPGLRCVGAPIRDQTGRVFAGISVSGPARRISDDEVKKLSALVMHNASAISAKLGFRG